MAGAGGACNSWDMTASEPSPRSLADFARAGLRAPHLESPLTPTHADLQPLGWGVVGPGAIAQRVVPEIAMLPDARLIAVSSRSRTRGQDFAERHGFVRSYSDEDHAHVTGVQALSQDPDVDVVYVASPHGYHHQHVTELLRAGKHVVCEKALAVTAAEVRDLLDLAHAQGVLLMEAVWTAMTPGFRRVMQLVEAGTIGSVSAVTGSIGFHATPEPTHRLFNPDDGGGVTLDMLVYPLLYVDALLGAVQNQAVIGTMGATGVDDDLALQLQCANGWAQLSATLRRVPATGIALSGTEGWLRVDGRLHNPPHVEWMTQQRRADGLEPVIETIPTVGAGYVPQMREATRCIREGLIESPMVPWHLSMSRAELFDSIRAQIS